MRPSSWRSAASDVSFWSTATGSRLEMSFATLAVSRRWAGTKVNVIRDLIHEKNPDAAVSIHPIAVGYENQDAIRTLIAEADIVIGGTDNRPSKLLINQLCIEAGVVAVYGGAFRRAYGGQVLRVRPKDSPCHQCFVATMPEEASDIEISTPADAEGIAYSDQPVAVEPGLSLDVLPIANMLTKLALLELVADKESSLNILKRDFEAPWVPLA